MKKLLLKAFMLVMLMMVSMEVWAADVINNESTSSKLGSTATSSWVDAFDLTLSSGAVVNVRSMGTKSTSNALQWNANGYLYMKTSGGTLKSVTIKGASKTVNVYASNTAYSAAPSGTALGTISVTSTGATYNFTSDYTYLALQGTASSTSITEITIEYATTPTVAYTVTFNAGSNGTCSTSSLTEASAGAGVTLPSVTANTGYRFEGWSTSTTPTSADAGKAGATYKPSSNCTLYAYYVPVHTAQFSINGTITPGNNCTVANGETITFPADPAVDGVVFKGWAKDAIVGTQDDAPTMVDKATETMGTEDVTYYAVFAMQEGEETTETFGWEEATTPANWTIGGTITRTAGTETNPANSGSYYGALNANCSIKFKNKVKVNSFSYYCVRKTTNTNTSIKIETSTNGTTWTEALSTTWNTFNSDGKTYKKIEKTWDEPIECYVRVNIVTAAGRMLDDISITYGDVTYSDYCTSVSPLSSIAITTAPNKVLYRVGEDYDATGLVITATYENGNTKEVTASCTNNAESPLTAGHKTITYTYNDKTCTQEIDVVALDHIAVTTEPDKTEYTEDEDFDATGMVVTATWGSEVGKTIDEEVSNYTLEGDKTLVPSVESVTISYTHEGTTKTTTQAITVNAIPTYTLHITQPEEGGALTVKNGETPLVDGAIVRIGTNLTCEVTNIPEGKRFSRFYVRYDNDGEKYKETNPATFDNLPTEGITAASVSVTYKDLAQYTINWSVNGKIVKTENLYENSIVTAPDVEVPNYTEKVFTGWVTTSTVDAESAPSYVYPTTATADATYYAVFANLEGVAGGEVTESLTSDDIKSLSSSQALAYSTEKTYTDGEVAYSIYAYTDNTSRPWMQLKKDQGSYVKMTAPSAIKKVVVTITSPTNSSGGISDITKHSAYSGYVALTEEDCTYSYTSTSVASTNSITNNQATLTPAGSKNALYLKVSTGARIWGIDVTFGEEATYSDYCTNIPASSAIVSISSVGYATYYDSKNAYKMPKGLTGCVVTWDNEKNNIVLDEYYESDDIVPAGEPLVLKGEEGNYTLVCSSTSEPTLKSLTLNILDGMDEAGSVSRGNAEFDNDYYFYSLSLNASNDPNSIGFYWMTEDGSPFIFPEGYDHKAYLVLEKDKFSSENGARAGFSFNDDTEAISTIMPDNATTVTFNLNGMRVDDNVKGFVIRNGKKMLVK